MKIAFKISSISLLLMAGMMSAYANPGQRQNWRDDVRAVQLQQTFEQRGQGNGEQVKKDERRPAKESSGFGAGGQGNTAPEESRKPGRMTPEERRALRRQINEAGRDIYAPTR